MKAFRWSLAAACVAFVAVAGVPLKENKEAPFLALMFPLRLPKKRKVRKRFPPAGRP